MINGLAEKLQKLRWSHGLSQKQIANKLNISPSIVSAYETGARMPSIENLLAFSQIFNCSVDYLLGNPAQEPLTTIDVSGLGDEQIQALNIIVDTMKNSSESK